MNDHVQWTGSPSDHLKIPAWERLVPSYQRSPGGYAVNHTILGAYVHWDDTAGERGRDVLCTGLDICPLCPRRSRWKGWLLVRGWELPVLAVLQFSENAYEDLRDTAVDMEDLRGLAIRLKRSEKRKRSPVILCRETFKKDPLPIDDLPAPQCLKPYILRLLGVGAAAPSQLAAMGHRAQQLPFREEGGA